MISSATANPVLSGILAKFMANPQEYVGFRLFPTFNTALQSAQYYVFDRENLLNTPTDLQRAPGGNYRRVRMRLSDDTYACKEYGLEVPVDDRERKKYSIAFNADQAAVLKVGYVLMFNHELRVQAKAATLTDHNPVALWDDYQTSNPMTDINAGKEAIHDNIGIDPNLMVIGRDVFNILREHPKILDKIKYTQRGIVTPDLLAPVFGVDEVLVAGGIKNTAAEGQTISAAKIWGKDCYLARVNPAQDLQALTYARTFGWTGETGPDGYLIESYRDDEVRSDIHRGRGDMDEKVTCAEAAYKLTSVIA